MDRDEIIEWLRQTGTPEGVKSLTRYGIPNTRAFGVPMRELKQIAEKAGRSHELAAGLWDTGWYEARTIAVFVEEPSRVSSDQMDRWAHDFDSWAICDTACFHLFDKSAYAWEKVAEWADAPEEFVKRASFALLWALALHDKEAPDERFHGALTILETAQPDPRPLVKKAMDMALRAMGKRNPALRTAALGVAERMALDVDKHRAWIGTHAGRELRK